MEGRNEGEGACISGMLRIPWAVPGRLSSLEVAWLSICRKSDGWIDGWKEGCLEGERDGGGKEGRREGREENRHGEMEGGVYGWLVR